MRAGSERVLDGRPRVVIVSENESVPGDRRVWDISTTLVAAGAEVTVICPQDDRSANISFERREGVEIHRYPARFATCGMFGYLTEYGWAFWQTWRLMRRLVRKRPFDAVHACNPPDFLLYAAWPARRRGARFIFDHHDLTPELFVSKFGRHNRPVHRLTLVLERLGMSVADVVISTNEAYRDVACSRGGKRATDVFVVPNAPDLRRLKRGPPDTSLKRGKPHLIAYLGVMAPQDGVANAVEALAILHAQRQDWHAVFGGEGSEREALMALAVDLGVADSVEFVGWLEDEQIATLLSTADVCLSPEPSTPLNDRSTMVKVGEYMAMARPIVAFELPQTRRTAGGAATYARSGDVTEYASKIVELLDSPERREQMGALGRDRVQRSLTWDHSTSRLLAAYRHALSLQAPTIIGVPAAPHAAAGT